jgi:hypothetical protein
MPDATAIQPDTFPWAHEVSRTPSRTDKLAYLNLRAAHSPQPRQTDEERYTDSDNIAVIGWIKGRQAHTKVSISTPPVLNAQSTVTLAFLDQVQMLHDAHEFRAASDRLLSVVDKYLQNGDLAVVQELLAQLQLQLTTKDEIYKNDRAQARLINVLAMTSEFSALNIDRTRLVHSFFAFLEKHFGGEYASSILGQL